MENKKNTKSILKSYNPLIIIICFIMIGVLVIQSLRNINDLIDSMRIFMGLFFITFGFFKTLDWKGFVNAYVEYDIIAKRSGIYAYIYPIIELTLGVFYLANIYSTWVNLTAVAIMGVSSIGVIKILRDKKKIRCACLGTVVKLPMTTVTAIEDIGMGLMALVMLIV